MLTSATRVRHLLAQVYSILHICKFTINKSKTKTPNLMCPGTCEAGLQPWPRDLRAPAAPEWILLESKLWPTEGHHSLMVLDWFFFLWNARSLCFIKVAIIIQEIILNSYRSLGPSLSFSVNNQRQTKTKCTYISLDTHSYTEIIFSRKASTCLPYPWCMSLNTLTSAFLAPIELLSSPGFQHGIWQNYPKWY